MTQTEFKYKAKMFHDVFELLKVDVADEICNDPAISKVKIVETGGIEDHAAMAFFIRRALEKIVGEKNNSVLYGRDINPSFVLREWYEIEDMITARTMTEPSVTEPSIELIDVISFLRVVSIPRFIDVLICCTHYLYEVYPSRTHTSFACVDSAC
jgi:hypothetical protein